VELPFDEQRAEAIRISNRSRNRVKYFVFIEQLPNVSGMSENEVVDAIDESLFEWEKVCNVDFFRVPVRAAADLIIKEGRIDGGGNTLALTDLPLVSQRVSTQLEMVFDTAETFSENGTTKFSNVLTHELGHAIGISHGGRNGVPAGFFQRGDLMFGSYQDNIATPQTKDISVAVRLWGKPRD
jgi:hypothetical protein